MAILHETKFISAGSMLILPLFIDHSQWDSFHDWSFCLKKIKEIIFFPNSLKISLENNVSNFEDPLAYVTHLLCRKGKKEIERGIAEWSMAQSPFLSLPCYK